MLCDVCKEQDATVHLTRVVEGEVTLMHLCASCAAERGLESAVSGPPKNMLGEFLHAVQSQAAERSDDVRCSFCGLSMQEFRIQARLGCARCYAEFEPQLRDLLRRLHGSSTHVGRKYLAPDPDILQRASTRGELQDRLRRAIANEEFEIAAALRDKIRGTE